MISLTIGNSQRRLASRSDIEENWINQQINGRRADGQTVCVRVLIEHGPVNLSLGSAGCPGGGGGGSLGREEQRIVDLWLERGLGLTDFAGGNVVAFLHQLLRMLG